MPQSPYILTGVDVRRVDAPDSSRVDIIESFTAPAIKHKTISHTHGGGIGTVDYVLPVLEAFKPTFETVGPDFDSLAAVGLVTGNADMWVFAGSYLRRGVAKPIGSRIIIAGTVSEIDEGSHAGAGADKQKTKHVIDQVTHYERHVGGEEWIYWDIGEKIFRVKGRGDVFAPFRGALGI